MDYVLKYKAYVDTYNYGAIRYEEGHVPTDTVSYVDEIRVALDDWDASVVGPLIVSRMNAMLDGRYVEELWNTNRNKIWIKGEVFDLSVLEDRDGNLVTGYERVTDVRAISVDWECQLYLDHADGSELEYISWEDVFDLRLDELAAFAEY